VDEDERQMRQQLMLHEALVQAIDRRDEVFQVIGFTGRSATVGRGPRT